MRALLVNVKVIVTRMKIATLGSYAFNDPDQNKQFHFVLVGRLTEP